MTSQSLIMTSNDLKLIYSETLSKINFYAKFKKLIKHGNSNEEWNGARALPNFEKRNSSQFWVFQNKESGIKGSEQPSLISKELDEMFNLTISYKR